MEDAASRGKRRMKQGGLRLRGPKVPRLTDLWTRVLSGPAFLLTHLEDRESNPCLWSIRLGKEINQWPRGERRSPHGKCRWVTAGCRSLGGSQQRWEAGAGGRVIGAQGATFREVPH